MSAPPNKEDAQMVCPLAFDDPSGECCWARVVEELSPHLPLREVVCKSPTSGTPITIASLPIRFLPSTANLFKDTDHPFRWFLAPYVEILVVHVESLDAYKTAKASIKAWVDARNSAAAKKASWLLLYVPLCQPALLETYHKVYLRLCGDFYVEKSGDRSVFLLLSSGYRAQSLELPPLHGASITDFLAKVRKSIVSSFQLRTTLYDADIRRLDSSRGTPQLDFRQLFLVKESLALMYQMMQLPSEAFVQYEELEALLAFSPPGQLPENEWPMASAAEALAGKKQQALSGEGATSASTTIFPENAIKESTDAPCRNGEEVLIYSINTSRMKILKNKMSVPELHRYLFARQMYFLTVLKNPLHFAQKGLSYLTASLGSLIDKLAAKKLAEELVVKNILAYTWAMCAVVKIFQACQEQFNLHHPNQGGSTLSSKEASLHLSEIARFALATLQRLTGALKASSRESLAAAFAYSCWCEYPQVPHWTPNEKLAPADAPDEAVLLVQSDEDFDLSRALRDLAPQFLLPLGQSPSSTHPLLVHFLKLMIATETSAGRKRFASYIKMQLADLYFCIGGSSVTESIRMYLEILSTSFVPENKDTLTGDFSNMGMYRQWSDVRYCLLRKTLLVARMVGDKHVYCFTAMQILDPAILTRYVASPALAKALLNDVAILSREMQSSSVGVNTFLLLRNKSPTLLPLKQYFKTSICFDFSGEGAYPTANRPGVDRATKIIHDESVTVTMARLQGGATHSVALHVHSLLPDTVTIAGMGVTYCAFNILQARAVTNSQSLDEFDRDNMFECFPCLCPQGAHVDDDAELRRDTRPIQIHPGEQILRLKFRAPCTGEYGLMSIQMDMGALQLRDSLEYTSLASLLSLSQQHTMVSVEQPSNLLDLRLESPAFSPTGQPDDFRISFSTLAGDQLTGLRIWAIPGLVSFEDSQLCGGQGEMRSPVPEFPVWSKKLQAPLPPPVVSSGAAHITIDKASLWTVQRQSGGDLTAVPKKESSGLEHLSFSPLRGKSHILLKVPFSADGGGTETERSKKKRSKIVVSVILQGVLLRQGCAIAFDSRAECLVTLSDGLAVLESAPVGLFGGEFFLQCVLSNSSPIPLAIRSYSVSCYETAVVGAAAISRSSNKGGQSNQNQWTVIEGPAELVDEACPRTSPGLILHPRNEYHAAYQIKAASEVAGAHRRVGRAQISFAYQRAAGWPTNEEACTSSTARFDRGGAELAQWANSRTFKVTCPIQHPSETTPNPSLLRLSTTLLSGSQDRLLCGSTVTLSHTLVIEEEEEKNVGKENRRLWAILVRPCETDEWVPVGRSRQVLRCEGRREPNAAHKHTFLFHTDHVPVIVGDLPLPPLSINLIRTSAGETDQHPPASLLDVTKHLLEGDSICVLPTGCTTLPVGM